MNVLSVVSVLLIFIQLSKCSKILVIFSSPSKSHTILGMKFTEVLLKRGHHVTLATPFPVAKKDNLTHINLEEIVKYREEVIMKEMSPDKSRISTFFTFMNFFKKILEITFEHPDIQTIIKEKPKYDAMVLIAFFTDSVIGIGHHLGIPVISFSCVGYNFYINKLVGNPNVVYAPNAMTPFSADTFFGRLATVTSNFLIDFIAKFMLDQHQEGLLKKHIPNPPTLEQLRRSIPLVLVNSHYSLEPPRPYLPNMIQVGGFHVQETKELPKTLKNYLDGAKKGAILFSLGSNVQIAMITEEKLDSIFRILGELSPMRVIFKSELEHKEVPENVMVMKWVPQADILAHPNIKVFISHGGYGGNTEAVYHGVPILGFPFFGDQLINMLEAEKAGYARLVSYKEFTEESFRNRLREVIEEPSYMENAKKRSALMREQPVKPADNINYWIEHIIKYGGGKHFQNPGLDLSWYQLYMFDIYVFYTILFGLLVIVNLYLVKFPIRVVGGMLSQKLKTN